MPWEAVLHDFDCFVSANPDFEAMRRLVYSLHGCASSELHATQTMGGNLLISPEAELHRNDNVLLVSFQPKEKRFRFEHRTISGNNDATDSSIDEAWKTLRLFIGYKFGVRLPLMEPKRSH
jgi:hypothetical protein